MGLFDVYQHILSRRNAVIVLDGSSMTGKTAVLTVLKNEFGERCRRVSCEEMLQTLVRCIREKKANDCRYCGGFLEELTEGGVKDFFCIESMHELRGKTSTAETVQEILRILKKTTTVVLTGSELAQLRRDFPLDEYEVLRMEPVFLREYSVAGGDGTLHGTFHARRDNALLAMTAENGVISWEDYETFYAPITLGDRFFLDNRKEKAEESYAGAWVEAARRNNRVQMAVCLLRMYACLVFSEEKPDDSYTRLSQLCEELPPTPWVKCCRCIADRLKKRDISRAEYIFGLVEERI